VCAQPRKHCQAGRRKSLHIIYTKGGNPMVPRSEKKGRSWLLLLLLIPFIAMLWPPFYNFREPALFGIPFFYWFQLLWVLITAIITAFVYFAGA
jgi:hypothetical protein